MEDAPHIVVIEDNPVEVLLLKKAFAACSFRGKITVWRNGIDAVDGIAAWNAKPPRLVLLDINLPGRKGIDVLAAIRDNAPLAPVPVLVLSSSQHIAERTAFQNLGVTQFFLKPFRFDGYVNLCRQLTSLFLS